MIAHVPLEILEEVAEVIASAARMCVKVDWMNKTLGRIAIKWKHLNLLKKSRDLEDELVQLDRRRDEITQSLADINAELVSNNLSLQKVNNYL